MGRLFEDPAGRDIDAATWFGPFGPLLVCLSDNLGYDLYTPDEWSSEGVLVQRTEYTADDQGQVIFHEIATGCFVPAGIRAHAIH